MKAIPLKDVRVLHQAIIILHDAGYLSEALALVRVTADQIDAIMVEEAL